MVHGPDGVPDRAVLRESPAQDPKPWGPWATLGFSALVYAVYFIASIGVIVWFSVQLRRDMPESKFSDIVMDLIDNGFVTSVTLVVASGLGIGLIMLLCWLRRGIEVADYLALKAFGLKTLLFWTALVIVFGVIYYFLSFIVQFQDLTALYMPLYETAGYVSLFFLTMIVISPLFEEIFFRGFLYRGLAASRLGTGGAILISSLFWAGIHLQYDAVHMSLIFALGLLLGLARAKSGSLYLTLTLHSVYNTVAFAWILLADHYDAGVA
jgi:membrane protease YdiL (CAAX protease family)